MPGLTGVSTQHMKLISGYVNSENNPAPASPVSSTQISGTLVSPYGGLVGGKLFLSADDAKKMSNTAVGTLFCGVYQMVLFKTAVTRGTLAFWDTTVNDDLYQVMQDETQNGGVPLFAGIVLNAVSAGNYGFIQTEGKATIKMRTTVTAATRYIAWAAAGAGADNATGDGVAAATTETNQLIWGLLGIAETAASNGALVPVNLFPKVFRQ